MHACTSSVFSCMHACWGLHASMHASVHACMHAYMHAIQLSFHACMRACMHVGVLLLKALEKHTSTACMHGCIQIRVSVQACMHWLRVQGLGFRVQGLGFHQYTMPHKPLNLVCIKSATCSVVFSRCFGITEYLHACSSKQTNK